MRKILIGSSALLAAGLIAVPSMAQEADDMMMGPTPLTGANLNLALGGHATATFKYRSAEPQGPSRSVSVAVEKSGLPKLWGGKETRTEAVSSVRNHAITFDSELHLQAEATLANGTSFGARIELEGIRVDAQKNIAENYIWVNGPLGKVYLGGYEGAPSTDVATSAGIYKSNGLLGAGVVAGLTRPSRNTAGFGNRIDTKNLNNKVAWQSPEIGGMSVALHFTPDPQTKDTDIGEPDTDPGQSQNEVYLGGKLVTALGDADVSLSLGYVTSSAEDSSNNANVEDTTKWRFGTQVAVSDINVRLYYVQANADAVKASPTQAVAQIGFGADYTFGDWKAGVGWERGSRAQHACVANGPPVANAAGVLPLTGPCIGWDEAGQDQASRVDLAVQRDLGNGMSAELGWRRTQFADSADMEKSEQDHSEFAANLRWAVGPGLNLDVEFANTSYTYHELYSPAADSERRRANSLKVVTKVSF
jgi:predicted porin